MIPPLRIGVLGTGRIGSMHAEFLARHIPGAVLAAVYDIAADAAGGVAAMLAAEAASTADELIGSPDVDAIAICTSTDTHVELIEAAARAGKAVFCEKPIAHDLAHVDRALAAVDQAGVPFMVGFNRRSTPLIARYVTRSPRAPSATSISSGSRAATRSRRRSRTCSSPAGSSST